jgi:transposase
LTDKELIAQLIEQVSFLAKRVGELEERLARYENPKNSRNSSMPPSMDGNRPKKERSLRRPTGRKPGGQHGHKGSTLEMAPTPDKIIELYPGYCRNCGSPLERVPATKERSRQIVDIPPIKAVWTEYRTFGKVCPCGCRTIADFPKGVGSPVSYGNNIEGLIGYFHARHYLPFARMKEMMGDVFNIDISEGGIHCLLDRFADRTTSLYEAIKERVSASRVIGTDETGVRVNGNKHWFWTWQTRQLTYIAHCATRGKAAVDAHFPNGFPDATLVRDGWRPQIATMAKYHQTCLPHLLRHLNYLDVKYDGAQWGNNFRTLLYGAMELDRAGDVEKRDVGRAAIVQSLERLLDRPPDKKHKELYTFYRRMCRERQHLFTFLFVQNVPPDNNASERAIRNVKVKQKISGQFRTERAAQNFAKIRSIIDTTLKNGQNVLEALALIAKLQPQSMD